MKEEKYIIRESLRIGEELTDVKVTSTVGTFLYKSRNGFQKIKITTPKTEPEKRLSKKGSLFFLVLNQDFTMA